MWDCIFLSFVIKIVNSAKCEIPCLRALFGNRFVAFHHIIIRIIAELATIRYVNVFLGEKVLVTINGVILIL